MQSNAREWLTAASLDCLSLRKLSNDPHLTPVAAFHAQQTVEKCLKALLELYEISFQKIHHLIRLHAMLPNEIQKELALSPESLDDLDSVYIHTRYPSQRGYLPEGMPTVRDAEELQAIAESVFQIATSIIDRNPPELKIDDVKSER
jgi:HEPN domain-containing protein